MTRLFATLGLLPRRSAGPLLAAALLGTSGCALRGHPELPAPLAFSAEVHRILSTELLSPEYYDAQIRLETMGPGVDAVLVALAGSPEARTTARANALILLADRRSPAALGTLRRALLTSNLEMLRSAAVLGLQRLASTSDTAANLIRSAVGDPARTVRLNALQALDIRDVETLRTVFATESDPEVRQVAMQLIALAESRGAPLGADAEGVLRTTAFGTDPRLAFRAARTDPTGGFAVGSLRVEISQARDVELGEAVEVVGNVVPAFFSPDRSKVVYEVGREIRVLDLVSRDVRSLGPGVAPRLIPFTHQFVFLREQPDARRETAGGTELRYVVHRGSFLEEAVEPIGTLLAVAQPDLHANYSPVRWMVVGETTEGFVLRGEGIVPFLLPNPIWSPAPARDDRFDDRRLMR